MGKIDIITKNYLRRPVPVSWQASYPAGKPGGAGYGGTGGSI